MNMSQLFFLGTLPACWFDWPGCFECGTAAAAAAAAAAAGAREECQQTPNGPNALAVGYNMRIRKGLEIRRDMESRRHT